MNAHFQDQNRYREGLQLELINGEKADRGPRAIQASVDIIWWSVTQPGQSWLGTFEHGCSGK